MRPESCVAKPISARVLALLALLTFATGTWAANVLIMNGEPAPEVGGAVQTRINATNNLSAQLVAAGHTVTVASVVPTSIGAFDMIWDIDFVHPITTVARGQYLVHLDSGKSLYLIGENQFDGSTVFQARNNSILDFYSAAGGGRLTFQAPQGDDLPDVGGPQMVEAVQAPFTGPNPVSTITYFSSGSVTNAGNGQIISLRTHDTGTTATAVVFNRLVVVLDVNFIEGDNLPEQSQPFLRNLIAYAPVPAAPELAGIIDGLGRPYSVGIHGGFAYVADPSTHTVWKVSLTAPSSRVPVAGIGWKTDVEPQDWQGYNGDGIESTEAQLDNPSGVALDADGNLYIADTGNHAIRRIGALASFITTAAGIPTSFAVGDAARLFAPRSVAADAAGNVYFSDMMNQQVKKLDKATGAVSVVVGVAGRTGGNNGTVAGAEFCPPLEPAGCTAAARLNSPIGVAVDSGGNVYVADEGNNGIRKVTPAGIVSTLPVFGLLKPTGVAVAPDGSVYIADYGNHRVVRATACGVSCTVTTVAGTPGQPGSAAGTPGVPGTAVQLNSPMAVTLQGNLLHISDMFNGRIVTINVAP